MRSEPDPGRRHPELPDAVAGTRPEKGRTDNEHEGKVEGSPAD